MDLAEHARNATVAALILAVLAVAGIGGMITTHKGNRGKKIKRR